MIIIMDCSCLHGGSWAQRPRPSSRKSCLVFSFSCLSCFPILVYFFFFVLTRPHPQHVNTSTCHPSPNIPPHPMSSSLPSHHTLTRLVVFHLICLHSYNLCWSMSCWSMSPFLIHDMLPLSVHDISLDPHIYLQPLDSGFTLTTCSQHIMPPTLYGLGSYGIWSLGWTFLSPNASMAFSMTTSKE